jgi:predicted NAD/FAD-binding protein
MDTKQIERSKVAIIGAGVSGLVSAYLLDRNHDVTVFEAGDRVGGHASTMRVEHEGRSLAVDTGFVVYNEVTYPSFVKLLDRLDVETERTDMSFSVRCDLSGLEYCGTNLNTLFAQRRNLVRLAFYRMIRDILRFNRDARRLLERGIDAPTLREFFDQQRYGREFVEQYIVPMAAAIWSASPEQTLDFPAHFFVRFFNNHGLLSTDGQLQWRVIRGGSQKYVEPLTRSFRDRVRTSTPVESVRRLPDGVEVTPAGRPTEHFDEVILALHSDQALGLLADPTDTEREILSALPYQKNDAVLHTDASVLPRSERARASWNYRIPANLQDHVIVTYDMSRLQNLQTEEPVCVSLNENGSIDPTKVIRRMEYSHPVFTPASIEAQARHGEISGVNRTHYCGAYWRNGFHEDGVFSALRVCRQFGRDLES